MAKVINHILWHNQDTHETQIWFMNGHRVASRATVFGQDDKPAFVGPPFSIMGTGDFNRDGTADILWHHSQTNESQIWFMDGHRVASRGTVLGENGQPAFVGLPFSIVGTGDFNRDGTADILWHNGQTNEMRIWFMDGHRIAAQATVLGENGQAAFVGLPFSIVGTGDFNRDGTTDILWHNSQTNETQIWFMDGHRLASRGTVLGENGQPAIVGAPFSIVGTADFNGDGTADILWHNSQTNEMRIWFMDRHRIAAQATVLGENGQAAFVGLPFSIAASGVALTMPEIALRYVGFHCFGETDELSASDEPYFTFGIVPSVVELKDTKQTDVYSDVDAGESKSDLIELYRGLPLGTALSVTLVEHDEGNPQKYRENVGKAVDAASAKVVEGLAAVPVVGILAVLGHIVSVLTIPAITDALNDLLGTEDDLIGTVVLGLTPADMLRLSASDRQDFLGIKAHLESPLISGDGASYKAYFDVVQA